MALALSQEDNFGSSTFQVDSGGFEYRSLREMAEFRGFHGVSMMKNLLGKVSAQSTSLGFRHESHGGHRAHEQARVKTEAANGGGRKASLYTGSSMRHRLFHEIDGASPSLTAARNPKLGIHGNSTSNVEEPEKSFAGAQCTFLQCLQ